MNTRQLSELEIRSDAVTRREFVKLTAATGLAVGVGSLTYAGAAEKNASGIPVRTLGRTGEKSPRSASAATTYSRAERLYPS